MSATVDPTLARDLAGQVSGSVLTADATARRRAADP